MATNRHLLYCFGLRKGDQFHYNICLLSLVISLLLLALGAGNFLLSLVAPSNLWPIHFDNVIKMLLPIHYELKLPSYEVVLLNNVHEMRSFCALVFKPIKLLMISSFCILTIRMTVAYNSTDWPCDCLFVWHIPEDQIWLTLSIHCHSCLLMSFYLSTESLSDLLAFCVLISHLPNSLDCRT